MDRRYKSNVPASLRIAFVAFIALGVIIIGFLWMSYNDWKDKADTLASEVSRYEEVVESHREQYDAPVDDEYIEDLARENGYLLPGEQIYPFEHEE